MIPHLLADAWWSTQQTVWIGALGGSALGIMGGLIGTLAGIFAPRGKGRALILGLMGVVFIVCVGILILGVVALILVQPYAVWYPCLLIGFIGTVVVGSLIPVVHMAYRQAEQRQLDAQSLRGAR